MPPHDLPGSLRPLSSLPFVGRTTELETLRTLLPRAEGEGSRVVLVGGEPGSGKSRLVREFAAASAAENAIVLYGACDPEVHAPYGPFVEALDHLSRTADPATLRDALGSGGAELTRILPELSSRIGGLDAPVRADPDAERHRLHTAVADLLAGVSRGAPLLLVLEDCHWADAPTLLLVRHLARSPGHGRVLLLATFRDARVDVSEPLSETLADLRRSDGVVRVRLAGLSEQEVTELVRSAAGAGVHASPPELTRVIVELTDGNPFLVCELWRTLVETLAVEVTDGAILVGKPLAELGTPESVEEVVNQRLARVDGATIALLELAAAAGPEFGFDLVRQAAGFTEPELLRALDEAVGSGMIEELTARGLAYRFTHELVRRAVYARLTAVRRAELHLRVGEALEQTDRSARTVADLAHHFAAAAALDGAARAVAYNLEAARAAVAALAFDEAAARLQTALELGIPAPSERAEAFLELGHASHRGGKSGEALAAFGMAAGLARELDSPELLARAAIGYEETCWRPGIHHQGAVELLEEAALRLSAEDSELRARLLGGLARALDLEGDHERGGVIRQHAVTMARNLADPAGVATILVRSYWSGSITLEAKLEMLTEARDIGEQLGDTEIAAEAMAWRVPAFVAVCDLGSARREVAALLASAEQTAQPFMLHVAEHYGAALALGDGLFQEAEARALRSHEWSHLLTGRDAFGVHGIQMFSLRREQGRLAELAPVIRILSAQPRSQGPWRPGLVSLLAELGMETEARRELSEIAREGLDALRGSIWLGALTYLTDASAALGDEGTAALVYEELQPLAGSNVMIGHLVACYGAADRYLGMLATTLGEWERAQAHFELALELNRRMGAATWVARTAYEYARLLQLRPRSDRALADALRGEAAQLAERIGMPTLLTRIRALGPALPTSSGLPDGLSAREAQVLSLVVQGLSNREIGSALVISEHTAANHVRSILRKTGCANRTEAASYAHRRGLALSP